MPKTKPPSSRPAPAWERLRPWHVIVGLPTLILYALAPWLASRGVPVPGPLLWLAAFAIGASIVRQSWTALAAVGPRAALHVALAFVAAFVLQNIVWATVTRNAVGPISDTNAGAVLASFGGSVALLVVAVGFIGPIVEEVLYRFILFRSVALISVALAHLTTAFIFGLQHVALAVLVQGKTIEWWSLPGYALFGLCLTLLYQRDRSLLAPLAMHVLANALSLAFLLAR